MKKYLIKSKIFFKLYLIYFALKYKFFTNKKSYSQFGEDIIVQNYFGDFIGTYVDVGCFHPIKYSNTALLHKKGWKGFNIDLNETSIKLFDVCRKDDINLVACLSDKNEEVQVYIDSEFSELNSMNPVNAERFDINHIKKKTIKTQIFSDLIKDNFDFLNIDCEGNDLQILKTIDLKRYTPKLINIEVSSNDKKDIYDYLNLNNYKILEIKSMSHIFKKEN